MSRSNPNESTPNPATRWISWSGSRGELEFYDKEKKETKSIGDKFSFLLLDQLASVRGWHDASESGIYSNEVRDTRSDRMTVKAFKGGVLAEGIYSEIKEKVNAKGGKFNANLYLAYKQGTELKIGALTLSGAALAAWMEFSKANKASGDKDKPSIYNSAIQIDGSDEGQKGSVKFKTPKFFLQTVTPETNASAIKLDKELQEYLKAYLTRNKANDPEEGEEDEDDPHAQKRREEREAAAVAAAENKAEWDKAEKDHMDEVEFNKRKAPTPLDAELASSDIPF